MGDSVHEEGQAAVAKQATVIHGDVVGYSKLIADNEIETQNTLQAFRRIIDEEVAATGGDLAQFVGDEFLALFPTASDAIGTAVAVQRRTGEENQNLPPGRKMRFRLGINSGEVHMADGNWYGDTINVAARLQALADPGGINVAAATLESAGEIGLDFEPLGKKRLKNIPEPVAVFKLIDHEAISESPLRWRRRIPRPSRPSLAVSPFVNLGHPEDSHFADGLMMALVISLMRIPGLDLVSENSTLRYRDQLFSAQQLGHELGVRYVLEGAVQRSADRVRVMTQLLDVDHGTTVWADRFEARFEDVFSAQDAIVSSIVEALDLEVIGGEVAHIYRSRLDARTVEVAYRGLQYLSNGTPADLERAIETFDSVIELAPDEAMGYTMSALSHLLVTLWAEGGEVSTHLKMAEEFASEAIRRGDPVGLGHTVLAHVLLARHDWDGALEVALQATRGRPSCDLTYGIAASVLRYAGRYDEAVEYANRAIRLSPLFATWYESILANANLFAGNYDEAADVAESIVSEDESQLEALLTLAAAEAALGRHRHAAAAIDHARLSRPDLSTEALMEALPYRDREALGLFISQLEAAGLN